MTVIVMLQITYTPADHSNATYSSDILFLALKDFFQRSQFYSQEHDQDAHKQELVTLLLPELVKERE
jgi:hypothetical protein